MSPRTPLQAAGAPPEPTCPTPVEAITGCGCQGNHCTAGCPPPERVQMYDLFNTQYASIKTIEKTNSFVVPCSIIQVSSSICASTSCVKSRITISISYECLFHFDLSAILERTSSARSLWANSLTSSKLEGYCSFNNPTTDRMDFFFLGWISIIFPLSFKTNSNRSPSFKSKSKITIHFI